MENLNNGMNSGISRIEGPTDQRIVEALEVKLQEYKKRLDNTEFTKDPFSLTVTNYKIALLEELFKSGSIDLKQVAIGLVEKYGPLDKDVFVNAVSVINDYIVNEGKGIIPETGTGLNLG
mgnify:CR=1 FL=1